MGAVVIPLLLLLALAFGVIVLTVISARRQGDDLLTPQGPSAVDEARRQSTELVKFLRRTGRRIQGQVQRIVQRIRKERGSTQPATSSPPAGEVAGSPRLSSGRRTAPKR